MGTLEYAEYAGTRDFLQDIARVLGKVQQTYTLLNPHDWQRGLQIIPEGLCTTELPGEEECISLDMQRGVVRTKKMEWKIADHSAQEMMKEFKGWLVSQGITKVPDEPEYITTKPEYDPEHAATISQALKWAHEIFTAQKKLAYKGTTSPVLLYPHHFDLSLVWFPQDDEKQLSWGFSLGDKDIPEPYFYSSAYPEPPDFTSSTLPSPAYWHEKGFRGAVLLYDDAQDTVDPRTTVLEYCDAAQQRAKDTLV